MQAALNTLLATSALYFYDTLIASKKGHNKTDLQSIV